MLGDFRRLWRKYRVNCYIITAKSSKLKTSARLDLIMLNIVTIHAIRKTLSLPKTSKTLLLSLAVSDVGVGLLSQPFYTALLVGLLQQHNPGCEAYTVFTVITYVFCMASFFKFRQIFGNSPSSQISRTCDSLACCCYGDFNMAAKSIFSFDDFMGWIQCLLSCGASPRSCFARSYSNG